MLEQTTTFCTEMRRMKRCLRLALLAALVLGLRPVRAQVPAMKTKPKAIATPGTSRWIVFFDRNNKKRSTVRLGDLVFTEKFVRPGVHREPNERGDFTAGDYKGNYRYYVQRDGQTPRLLFTSMRGASMQVGHRNRLVLIENACATQCEDVYVADLETDKHWRVDEHAKQVYDKNFQPDPRLTILPYPIDFSPDDTQVLISARVRYIQVPSKQMARNIGGRFRQVWYAVDSVCGRVMRQYLSDPSRQDWWAR